MKRRTKSYIVTHVAYDAKLRPPTKYKPATAKEWLTFLLFLAIFLYFTTGVVFAQTLLTLPSNPSKDFNVFKRQFAMHNLGRIVEKAKANNYNLKTAAKLYQTAQNPTIVSSPKSTIKSKVGLQPLKGLLYSEIDYHTYTISNEVNAVALQYSVTLKHKGFSSSYTLPLNTKAYKIGLAYNLIFE